MNGSLTVSTPKACVDILFLGILPICNKSKEVLHWLHPCGALSLTLSLIRIYARDILFSCASLSVSNREEWSEKEMFYSFHRPFQAKPFLGSLTWNSFLELCLCWASVWERVGWKRGSARVETNRQCRWQFQGIGPANFLPVSGFLVVFAKSHTQIRGSLVFPVCESSLTHCGSERGKLAILRKSRADQTLVHFILILRLCLNNERNPRKECLHNGWKTQF